MSRPECTVCARADREDIELIAKKEGPRAAGRVVGCSHYAIMRHMSRHTGAAQVSRPSTTPPKPDGAEHPTDENLPLPDVPKPLVYSQRHQKIADLKTAQERRKYVQHLFRTGRFDGFRTTGLLSVLWDDLGPMEFAELISNAAIELNFRRGSEQTRRAALLGKVERLYRDAIKKGDIKAATRLLELLLKYDVPVGVDLMTALASTAAWPVVARELQQHHPEAFERVYGVLSAEESRKRQALAPATIEAPSSNE